MFGFIKWSQYSMAIDNIYKRFDDIDRKIEELHSLRRYDYMRTVKIKSDFITFVELMGYKYNEDGIKYNVPVFEKVGGKDVNKK